MTRVWDYIGFGVCFAGLGYVGLWLVGSPDYLALPPALHAFGGGAAAFVPVRAILYLIGRRRAAARATPAADSPKAAASPRPLRRKATYPIRQVAPRSQFGLRGAQDRGA
jgi:hypothetical protein